MRRRGVTGLVFAACILTACDDGGSGSPASDAAVGADATGAADMSQVDSLCDVDNLIAQCPPGSLPTVDAARLEVCDSDGQLTDDSGSVTGQCYTRETCSFACNFSSPCQCGVERIDTEGVFCAPCVAACGDAVCEGGESPETCPIDCAERCTPDNERCDGNDREVCEDTGTWTKLTCRASQRCIFAQDEQRKFVSLCETVISPGGAEYVGMGEWAPSLVDDYSAVRFPVANVDYPPIGFEDDGLLLTFDTQSRRFLHLDLSTPDAPVITELPGRAPVRLETNDASHFTDALAISRERIAGRNEIWDIKTERSRLTEDFGGLPTTWEELANVDFGRWIISPDGAVVARSVRVFFDGKPRTTTIVWNAETGSVLSLLRFVEPLADVDGQRPNAMVMGMGGRTLVSAYPNEMGTLLVVWNVEAERYSHLIQSTVEPLGSEELSLVASSAGDDRIALITRRHVEVWDVRAPARLLRLDRRDPSFVTFTPDGTQIVVDGDLINIGSGQVERSLPGTGERPYFDPQSARILIGGRLYGTGE